MVEHQSKEGLKTEKSSMKTSMHFSTMSTSIASMHLRKVAGPLHDPNGILLYAKTPKRHVKAVFSLSLGYTVI